METLPERKNLRLKQYDYSQNGCYFITICTYKRERILSNIRMGVVEQYPLGKIVENQIKELPKRYNIKIDSYVIMPDHIHIIIKINQNPQRAEQSPAPTIGDIICAFKSLTTKIANRNDNCFGRKLWQRNYYEHIIRNETDYLQSIEYIANNPLKSELLHNPQFF